MSSDWSGNYYTAAQTRHEKPTGRLRIVKGTAGTMIPDHFGLEQEWLVIDGTATASVQSYEWRPVPVVSVMDIGRGPNDHG